MRNDTNHPFPHHKLDAWHVAVELAKAGRALAARVPTGDKDLAQQLKRSSTAVALLVAEGAGRRAAGEYGKHYFLAIKEPQGGIHAYAVQQLGRRADSPGFELVLRERGKWIGYRVWTHETPDGYLDWSHARQLVRVERTVTTVGDDGEITDETVGNRFFVTSYAQAELGAADCYKVARHHWRCENCGHWTADAVWKEDARRTPWARKNPDAIYVAVVLRAIGLSIVAVLRAMTRRDYAPREQPPWAEVIDDVKVALRTPLPRHEPGSAPA